MVCVPVCDMCEREGYYADFPLRTSCGVQEVLRQNHPDGSVPASPAPPLRHLQGEDPPTEAEWTKLWRSHPAHIRVQLHGGRQNLGRPQLGFHLLYGDEQVGRPWFCLQLLHGQDVGRAQFSISVLHG